MSASHPRYWAAHKPTGTPPRYRTIRRLAFQRLTHKGTSELINDFGPMGTFAKRVRLGGRLCHPTKGWRPGDGGDYTPVNAEEAIGVFEGVKFTGPATSEMLGQKILEAPNPDGLDLPAFLRRAF